MSNIIRSAGSLVFVPHSMAGMKLTGTMYCSKFDSISAFSFAIFPFNSPREVKRELVVIQPSRRYINGPNTTDSPQLLPMARNILGTPGTVLPASPNGIWLAHISRT